jgi:hypothetical protein
MSSALQYGEMLDPRWPSRKYKDSRRFCYVQFLTSVNALQRFQLLDTLLMDRRFLVVGIRARGLRIEWSGAGARTRFVCPHIRP